MAKQGFAVYIFIKIFLFYIILKMLTFNKVLVFLPRVIRQTVQPQVQHQQESKVLADIIMGPPTCVERFFEAVQIRHVIYTLPPVVGRERILKIGLLFLRQGNNVVTPRRGFCARLLPTNHLNAVYHRLRSTHGTYYVIRNMTGH